MLRASVASTCRALAEGLALSFPSSAPGICCDYGTPYRPPGPTTADPRVGEL